MKGKIKRFIKQYLIGFILGLIVCGGVSVLAMTYFPSNQTTYDNSESGLESTNVQGAIDELYNTCLAKSAGEQIIENAGLTKDPYECRYFFTGKTPKNYITFNNGKAKWRILSIECDGTIKIIRNESIGKNQWNTSSAISWDAPTQLNTYLNETYFNDSLNATSKKQIVSHNFSIGAFSSDNIKDLKDQIDAENSKTWNGKIAIPTLSEYFRTNSNKECQTYNYYQINYSTCINSTWMKKEVTYWTLTPHVKFVYYILDSGMIGLVGNYNSDIYGTLPTFYISSDIKLTGGNGTQSNPYTIE